MTQEELENRLKSLAIELFPSANAWAVREGIKNVCRFLEKVNPGEYRELHKALFLKDVAIKEYEQLVPVLERLEKLAIRLDDDGQYVNANVCWLALAELQKS